MTRTIAISNRHPRLRFNRAAVARVVAILDEQFRILPGELRYHYLPRARLASLKSKIENPKSKISSGCPPGELSLVFLTDPALAKIHGDFMGDPTATDVITFAGDPATLGSEAVAKEAGLAGEICVSADTAMRYVQSKAAGGLARRSSAARGVGGDFSAELTLYLVHGWLHLAGYDDRSSAKKRRMRAAEQRAMAVLRKAKAVPEFRMR